MKIRNKTPPSYPRTLVTTFHFCVLLFNCIYYIWFQLLIYFYFILLLLLFCLSILSFSFSCVLFCFRVCVPVWVRVRCACACVCVCVCVCVRVWWVVAHMGSIVGRPSDAKCRHRSGPGGWHPQAHPWETGEWRGDHDSGYLYGVATRDPKIHKIRQNTHEQKAGVKVDIK